MHFDLSCAQPCVTAPDIGISYAVKSIPVLGEAQCSKDRRPRKLLNYLRRLLLDVSQMPLFGVNPEEYHAKLQAVIEADTAVAAAMSRRQDLFSQFVKFTASRRGKVLATYLEDLLVEFYD